jgi:hypothetical protein
MSPEDVDATDGDNGWHEVVGPNGEALLHETSTGLVYEQDEDDPESVSEVKSGSLILTSVVFSPITQGIRDVRLNVSLQY